MIVKKKLTSVFERLNNGDYEYALSDIGTTFEHHFSGKHCLGESAQVPRHCVIGSNVCFDCFRICGSKCIQSRHQVGLGILLSSLSGLIAPLLPTEKTM
jgi:hypothetical protein